MGLVILVVTYEGAMMRGARGTRSRGFGLRVPRQRQGIDKNKGTNLHFERDYNMYREPQYICNELARRPLHSRSRRGRFTTSWIS